MRMGPGYFPILLGIVLSGIGVVVLVSGLRSNAAPAGPRGADPKRSSQPWRPALLISASVLLFAITIESIGLAIATFGVVVVSSLANRDVYWPHVLASGLLMSMVSVSVFAYGLRLPFKVVPF
jgi:hypothetical protein